LNYKLAISAIFCIPSKNRFIVFPTAEHVLL